MDGRRQAREVPLFLTRALAEGFKAELVHAANAGLPFDPDTGLPFAWTPEPEPPQVTWYEHALAFVDMKWPQISANSRVSIAEGLATVTPCLVADRPGAPPPQVLRAALYGWAFNTIRRQTTEPDTDQQKALDWLTAASLPVGDLNNLAHIRHALQVLGRKLDGRPAALNTRARKRAVFHAALGHAVEQGMLQNNPLDRIKGQRHPTINPIDTRQVPSPRQVRAILAEIAKDYPDLVAFFGCLYFGGMRPEEAIALRLEACELPEHGWGRLHLHEASTRVGAKWTDTGSNHDHRALKHRVPGAIRIVPITSELVALLRIHIATFGVRDDGRLFNGRHGGELSESLYTRAWSNARRTALGPALAATDLAITPYSLRHAAVSLWLASGLYEAKVAARAGHSIQVLRNTYTSCIDGDDEAANQLIDAALAGKPRNNR